MDAVLELPRTRHAVREMPSAPPADLATAVAAMGKRLQAAYIEGALQYFRAHEPLPQPAATRPAGGSAHTP
ncbi:MAG: hypothetical protein ACE147_00250 [Candidatus Methylomirabilales bacterium]